MDYWIANQAPYSSQKEGLCFKKCLVFENFNYYGFNIFKNMYNFAIIKKIRDIEEVKRHPDFRFFACMNPATDVGKKSLPYGIQNRSFNLISLLFSSNCF